MIDAGWACMLAPRATAGDTVLGRHLRCWRPRYGLALGAMGSMVCSSYEVVRVNHVSGDESQWLEFPIARGPPMDDMPPEYKHESTYV